jgi:uncharacterized zinc-type alcohol dehydrogenase-like protein
MNVWGMVMKRRRVAGSPVGGLRETQQMLDFAGAHGILPEVELIRMADVNEAFARVLKGDVRYRFVIDMASLA